MRTVTISRQYGSGGGEVAARLAQRLGWELIDHQIVAQVARALDISDAEAESRDEHGASLAARVVNAILTTAPEGPVDPDNLPKSQEQRYHEAVCQILEETVRTRKAVIVGRGAQAFLGRRRDVLHLRIVAPLEQRIAYVTRREGLNERAARSRIQSKEHARVRYLQAHYHRSPDDPLLYDLVLNTGVLDLDSVVDLAVLALERKALRLEIPEERLGPGAGLERYGGRPGDVLPTSGEPQKQH
jgi:cytidylate kinase